MSRHPVALCRETALRELIKKIACGLRQVTSDMGDFNGEFGDRINGYAAELEAETDR